MVLETKYASRNIGDVFYTLRKDETLNGAVGCDNAKKDYYLDDFASDDPLSSISYLLLNGLIPVYSFADYDSQVKNNGCCARFGLDEASGKFRVPYLNKVYIQAGQEALLAQYLAAGLPNITGTFVGHRATPTGAFWKIEGSGWHGNRNNNGDRSTTYFDASKSNAIYGRSDTVQPPSVVLRPMVQLITVAGLSKKEEEGGEDTPDKPTDRLKVPYIFVPGTEAKALEVNANFDYVLRAIEESLGIGESYVDVASKQTITGEKTFKENIKVPAIEVAPKVGSSHGGYIDFHYSGSEVDYTARLIEDVRGYLSLNQSPPVSDSSTKIATTAWVNSKIASNVGNKNSWTKLPNGMIIQFGSVSGLGFGSAYVWTNFPTAFPTKCCAVAISTDYVQSAGNKGSTTGVSWNQTQVGFYPRFEQRAATVTYIAIGY